MKMHVMSVFASLLVLGIANAEDYPVGFTWDFSDDWIDRPASDHSTTNGNPAVDSAGSPVYSYEYFVGVPSNANLDSPDPWYTYPTAKLTWDDNWHNGGEGLWSNGNDTKPIVVQNLIQGTISDVSVIKWINPCSATKKVLFSVEPRVEFRSFDGRADVAICFLDASEGGSLSVIYTNSVAPSANDWDGNAWVVQLGSIVTNVYFDLGDGIVLTAKETTAASDHVFPIFDQAKLAVIPEEVVPKYLEIYSAVELGWFAASGTTYQVQYVTELTSTNWIDFGSPVNGNNTTNFVFDTTRGGTNKFYRVEEIE